MADVGHYMPQPSSLCDHIRLPDSTLIFKQIEANQRAYEDAAESRKRFLPFWLLRTQYRLLKANEPLWEQVGVRYPPMYFETHKGLSWAITRKLIGAGRA